MYQQLYIIEVQQYEEDLIRRCPELCGKSRHVGYMNIIFKSEKKARKYINSSFSECYISDRSDISPVDPSTKRRYVIRKYHDEVLNIPPFNFGDDNHTIIISRDNNGIIMSMLIHYSTGVTIQI